MGHGSLTRDQLIAQIRFGLSQLPARNGHHEFEEACVHLAYARIAPNPASDWASVVRRRPGSRLRDVPQQAPPQLMHHLKPIATRDPIVRIAIGKPGVETVDYFGFADTDDSYGIVKDDSDALTEEMDDATLPLALGVEALAGTPWLSIRNASDPQVASSFGDLEAQKKWAAGIYSEYGYWTTVGSAIACWAVVADLA
jgi:hypothetical protein